MGDSTNWRGVTNKSKYGGHEKKFLVVKVKIDFGLSYKMVWARLKNPVLSVGVVDNCHNPTQNNLKQLDPLLLLRDVPGVGIERGLTILAKVFLGIDVSRIKELAGLQSTNQFKQMTDTELEFGKTRVSD